MLRILILLVLACEFVFGGSTGDCNNLKKRYYLGIDKTNFFQAFLNCKNAGMELASTETEEEARELDAYLDPYKIEGYEYAIWLSGTNLNDPLSKQYYWLSTGHRAIYTRWVSTEPDNYLGVQHCMSWTLFQGKIGWADHDCQAVLRYVCEYRPQVKCCA